MRDIFEVLTEDCFLRKGYPRLLPSGFYIVVVGFCVVALVVVSIVVVVVVSASPFRGFLEAHLETILIAVQEQAVRHGEVSQHGSMLYQIAFPRM